MKLPWLEDSLSLNNRKPLDEVDKKYTWEIEHAEKVLKKRKEKQLAEKKEKLRALRAEAKEAADAARNDEDDGGDDKKVQQVIDCGRSSSFRCYSDAVNSILRGNAAGRLLTEEHPADKNRPRRHQIRQVFARDRERNGTR